MWTYQHTNFIVHQIAALNDNYIYLIQDCHSDIVCVVDPATAIDVQHACETLNLKPTHILNTHHHWDHTDGNLELIQMYGVTVIGNKNDEHRIKGITQAIAAEGKFDLGHLHIQTIDLPGHTLGHIAFLIDDALFCGDTLFGGGCGRLFEGSFEQMWESLQKIATLNKNTKIYCAHEYTLPNLRFARDMDSDNKKLIRRISDDTKKRMQKIPTIPSSLELELQTNPFLRPLEASFIRTYNQENNTLFNAFETFKHLRERKNSW